MGLIKAAVGAIGSTLKDQWKEAIRCEDLGNDILMMKKTSQTGVISNKSTVIVGPGQCAIIYDNGRVIDATAEEGVYTFDDSSTPSFFAGQFGEVFKEMWQRFTYNGATAKQQAVFFFNIKEIIKNNFGTPAPIPFQDWSHPIPNQMTGQMIPLRVEVKCFGKYTFKISNPAAFMNEIAGTANVYRKADLLEQMRAEVIASFQNVLNELGNSEHKVPVLELPSRTDEIKRTMDEKVFDEPLRRRGISIIGFAVESVTLDEDSEKKIDSYELSSNSYMQQGTLVGAYSNAVQDAAKNANGAANGFMGIGMMNMASGNVMTGAATGPWQNGNTNNQTITNEQVVDKKDTWECPNCKKEVEGNFCSTCGTKKQTEKFCPNCGKKVSNDAKFCTECGTKL
ncbi:MAG: SPFH domain-containing protein [Clostridia bacterium]|jgi:membrane protease subunit (stomatin/prohibitin family)|nr:putative virion core protein (Lumpy skin disease virus) [Clostridium sp. CAG:571]HJJ06650.1 SPFH domain-containing protein [Clostridiaceae bacterium]